MSSLVGVYVLNPGALATVSYPGPCASPSPLSTAGGRGGVAMGQESSRVLRSPAARAGNVTSLGGTTMSLTLCTIWGYGSGAVRNSPVVAERSHAVLPCAQVHVGDIGTK